MLIILIFLIPIVIMVVTTLIILKIAKKQMYHPAKEEIKAVSKEILLKKILKLNKNVFDVSKKGDFEIDWTISDAKWIGVIGKNWENYSYYGLGSLNNDDKTIYLFEKVGRSRRVSGMEGVRTYSYTQNGPVINTKIKEKRYAIKENGEIGEVMNFEFTPHEIKGVLKQLANDNGWNLQVVFSKRKLM
jgi:hypothetical protein